jgi:ribosomal protein S18 acetylase RimI-like enzyme
MEPLAFGQAVEDHRATTVEQAAVRIRDMRERGFIMGGFDHDALVGMAMFVREPGLKERHKGHIYGVYVTAAHRHRGLGHELIAALLSKAKEVAGLEQILLAVATHQETATRIYRKFGFDIYGTEPRALKVGSDYLDEYQMILRIR